MFPQEARCTPELWSYCSILVLRASSFRKRFPPSYTFSLLPPFFLLLFLLLFLLPPFLFPPSLHLLFFSFVPYKWIWHIHHGVDFHVDCGIRMGKYQYEENMCNLIKIPTRWLWFLLENWWFTRTQAELLVNSERCSANICWVCHQPDWSTGYGGLSREDNKIGIINDCGDNDDDDNLSLCHSDLSLKQVV